ncbi:hypothetical protein As57867_001953, partial [Aphanomyces stellatus]
MVKHVIASLFAAFVTAVPDNWGVQDVWVLTSTLYAGHCTCLCQPLCSHPTDFMKTNLVASAFVPRFNNFSVPRCNEPIKQFSPAAINAAGQVNLQNYYPFGFSRNVPDMWSPTNPQNNVPNFGYPCGGLTDTDYLSNVVSLVSNYDTPQFIKDN